MMTKFQNTFLNLPGFPCRDPRYISQNLKKNSKMVWNLLTFRMDKVKKTEPAKREITIRDLLSHASGLGQGWVGLLSFMKMKPEDKSLEERSSHFLYPAFLAGTHNVIHQWQALIFWTSSNRCLEKALKNICGKKFLHLWK